MSSEKYLIFEVCGKKFSIEFGDIKLIMAAGIPEKIPDFPEYIAGTVVNEGKIIPVIDLRRRFYYETKAVCDRDCIILTSGEKPVGLLADIVLGFSEIDEADIQSAPSLNREASARFLKGEFLYEGAACYIIDSSLVIKLEDEKIVMGLYNNKPDVQ